MFDPSQLEAFSALLHCVYAGATDPQAWPNIVQRVTEWVGGDKGALFTLLHRAGNGGFVFSYNIGAENVELWDTRFNTPDPLTARGIETGQVYQGSIVLSHQLLPMAELHQTTFYKDFLVPMNIEYQLINIVYGTERQPLMPMAYVAFNSRDSGPFVEEQRGKMQLLLPHISRAMGVLMTLRAAELRSAITLSAFDRLKTGALLLDPAWSPMPTSRRRPCWRAAMGCGCGKCAASWRGWRRMMPMPRRRCARPSTRR